MCRCCVAGDRAHARDLGCGAMSALLFLACRIMSCDLWTMALVHEFDSCGLILRCVCMHKAVWLASGLLLRYEPCWRVCTRYNTKGRFMHLTTEYT